MTKDTFKTVYWYINYIIFSIYIVCSLQKPIFDGRISIHSEFDMLFQILKCSMPWQVVLIVIFFFQIEIGKMP